MKNEIKKFVDKISSDDPFFLKRDVEILTESCELIQYFEIENIKSTIDLQDNMSKCMLSDYNDFFISTDTLWQGPALLLL